MRITNKEVTERGTIFTIRIGYSEIEMIYGYLIDGFKKMPKYVIELSPARSRLGDMLKKFGTIVGDHRKEIGAVYTPSDYIKDPKKNENHLD